MQQFLLYRQLYLKGGATSINLHSRYVTFCSKTFFHLKCNAIFFFACANFLDYAAQREFSFVYGFRSRRASTLARDFLILKEIRINKKKECFEINRFVHTLFNHIFDELS